MTSNSTTNIYGYDLYCQSDMDPGALEVGGLGVLVNALYRRVTTPRGTLIYDPNYGYFLQGFVNEDYQANIPSNAFAAQIAAGLDQEFRKDQRVSNSTTNGTLVNGLLTLVTIVTTNNGPAFQLVLGVAAVYANPQILNVTPNIVVNQAN